MQETTPKKKMRIDANPPKKKKKKRVVYPYGPWAAKDSEQFKIVPSAEFATTLAALYPFLAEPEHEHEDIRKTPQYPITAVWPVGPVRRIKHFTHKCAAQMQNVLSDYESVGGEYYGPPISPEPSTEEDEEAMIATPVEDFDSVF